MGQILQIIGKGVNKQKLAAKILQESVMSKQIKQNCQRVIIKIQNSLGDLHAAIKAKKSYSSLQKLVTRIIEDFKFFHDDFKLLDNHLNYLQTKSRQKDIMISNLEKQLLNKNAEKKIFQQTIKSKYEKIAKKNKFLQFVGKSVTKTHSAHERCRSELIKKGLSELQKDIVQNNQKVCNKVRLLQNQIQNQEQGYYRQENVGLQKNIMSDINISCIAQNNYFQSPRKAIDQKTKLKGLQLNINDNIMANKTKKKQLLSRNDQKSSNQLKQREPKSDETIVFHRKKKEQLAQLIAQQAKIIVSRQKYFSTDI